MTREEEIAWTWSGATAAERHKWEAAVAAELEAQRAARGRSLDAAVRIGATGGERALLSLIERLQGDAR